MLKSNENVVTFAPSAGTNLLKGPQKRLVSGCMGEKDHIELLKKAQRGEKESLDRLAEMATKRLRLYLYRLTLDEELTQEILQETMLEMCRILGKLRRADKFWPWLYGIATNKIHRHQRNLSTQKRLAQSRKNRQPANHQQQAFENLVSRELKQIVAAAMKGLRTTHRAVLVMRCYDQMSYAEIAQAMGRSEFSTRMLFLRAKRALQKQLLRNGLSKGSLLGALVLFGKLTAPAEAAAQVSVSSASLSIGTLAGLVGIATTKTAIVSLSAAAVITVAAVVGSGSLGPKSGQIAGAAEDHAATISTPHNQARQEEYWYYFPEGPDNPVMIRVKAGRRGHRPQAQFLQNDQANYCFDNGVIYINNHRRYAPDLSVARLPTDNPQFSSFISRTEGTRPSQKMQYVPNRANGLLVVATRSGDSANNRPWVIRHYNVLDEGYFQGDWPTGLRMIDRRDAMHKRGWTFFTVTGRVNGQNVRGAGRIPFVYATSKRFDPWLTLHVGNDLTIVDTPAQAYIASLRAGKRTHYRPGTFFKGLSRPWMGLHTIDTVRRDAAEQRIPFSTKLADARTARVTLNTHDVTLTYSIDLQTDVVARISFSIDGSSAGVLNFSYLQNIEQLGSQFLRPRPTPDGAPPQNDASLLWLVDLARGSLGQ